MSNITTLFDNEDSSIFYDKKSNELIFKNKDVYYDINITTNNNESQNLKQKINNLFSIVQAIQITGKLGPQGKEGPRGKQGIHGEKGDQGMTGNGLEIDIYLNDEKELSDEYELGKVALIKNKLDLYSKQEDGWNFIGSLKMKGDQGDKGDRGDKGEMGKNLQIDLILNDDKELNLNTEFEDNSICIIKNSLDLYILKNKKWQYLNKLISVKGEPGRTGETGKKGERGERGERGYNGIKGDNGSSFSFNYIIGSKSNLPIDANANEFAIIKNSLEIYYHNNDSWKYLGMMKGERGERGYKGDKGDMGFPFKFKYIYNNSNDLENNKNEISPKENDFLLLKDSSDLYTYNQNKWIFITNIKGNKGDPGNGLELDLIINNPEELLNNNDMNNKFALEIQNLNLYFNKNDKWTKIGNLKGNKGDNGLKGEKGEKGEKGDIGKGIKIDYYFETLDDFLSGNINLNYGDIIFIKENNELKYWDKSCKNLGTITINKFKTQDINICSVEEDHQDFKIDRLSEIKFKIKNKFLKNYYKIKIIFCWECCDTQVNKNFYRDGILFFAEYNNELIKNSTKFHQGYPYSNTFIHEFIISNIDLEKLRFFIKINNSDGTIKLVNECNLIEFEQI